MKKFFVLSLLSSLVCSSLHAETKLSVGAGFNFNMVDTEKDLKEWDEDISVNLAIAGKAEIGINENWLFRTGLWLQEKSAKISYDKGGVDGSLKLNTIYTSIPLNLQYKANENISIFGGYIADLRINDYCNASGDFDNCSLNKKTQSIVHVGTVGVSIYGSTRFNVDISWQHGLSDVYKDTYKIHTLQAMAFYKFE